MKWIIDTDFSTNSQNAIDLLIKYNLDIVAFTVVVDFAKNHPLDIKNKMVEYFKQKYNKEYTIYVGAQEPYIDYSEELGDSKLEDPYNVTEYKVKIRSSNESRNYVPDLDNVACLKIVDLINTYGKDLSILSLSALTNISLAIILDNNISNKFDKLVVTGGSTTGKGNSGVFSEANFRADPVAAKNVIKYYKNIVAVPMEAEISFINAFKDNLKELGSMSEYVAAIIKDKKNALQFVSALYVLNNNIANSVFNQLADIDIVGKLTRGAFSIMKYEWLVNEEYNKITYFEELNKEEILKTLKN